MRGVLRLMNIYHFIIRSEASLETAWDELELAAIEVLYGDEDPNSQDKFIACRMPHAESNEQLLAKLKTVQAIKPAPDLAIDWDAQWSEHGLDFHAGAVHVRIGKLDFILKPGPGFGDASHPSTRLVLQMMEQAIQPGAVLDVGCGSGILSIAAAKLGGSPVYAIDIDPEAIRHTIENISINDIKTSLWVGSAQELVAKKPSHKMMALMNMISSEQKLAWASLDLLHKHIQECITSGILETEKNAYLAEWEKNGWELKNLLQEGEWLAFHFIKPVPREAARGNF